MMSLINGGDPKKYNWKWSENLAQYCSDHFDKWWDIDKFNWRFSDLLAVHCFDNFDKWWDCEKYDWYCLRPLHDPLKKAISFRLW